MMSSNICPWDNKACDSFGGGCVYSANCRFSRQVRVEPQAEDAVGNMIERGMAYNRGLAEGIRRCREAVEKKLSIYDDNEFSGAWEMNHGLKTALAAIDAVEGE
jgi:hypothetical protein